MKFYIPFLVLVSACDIMGGGSGSEDAASGASTTETGPYCFEPTRYTLNCTQPVVNADGYANTFCNAGLDIDDPALAALRDSIQADIADENFYVRKGSFRASVLGYTDVQMSEIASPWESGVLTNGTQYVGLTITSYGGGELSVGDCP